MQLGGLSVSLFAVLWFCLGASSAILSTLFLWQEIGEVNRKLPDTEKVSYWGMHPAKMFRIVHEYRRHYPGGKVDLLRRLSQYLMFLFGLLFLIAVGAFK